MRCELCNSATKVRSLTLRENTIQSSVSMSHKFRLCGNCQSAVRGYIVESQGVYSIKESALFGSLPSVKYGLATLLFSKTR